MVGMHSMKRHLCQNAHFCGSFGYLVNTQCKLQVFVNTHIYSSIQVFTKYLTYCKVYLVNARPVHKH